MFKFSRSRLVVNSNKPKLQRLGPDPFFFKFWSSSDLEGSVWFTIEKGANKLSLGQDPNFPKA